jgi:nitrite reductase/ring-hydroxylating ferredoxin subunit
MPYRRSDPIMTWISLCQFDELDAAKGKYVEIDGFQLSVFLVDGAVYVLDNTCPHAGGNLSSGDVEDGCIVCPWHQWAFELKTGRLRSSPGVRIGTYPARLLERPGEPTLVQADLPIY